MRIGRILAAMLALALVGGWSVDGRAGDCGLSIPLCAREGIVILGPRADRLTGWQRSTGFLPIEASSSLAGYILDHLGSDQSAALVLGRADLALRRYDRLIQRVVDRGGAVVVTNPTLLDAARLDEIAGIRGARWSLIDRARLYGVRMAQGDDGRTHPTAFVLLADQHGGGRSFLRQRWPRGRSAGLGEMETAWLKDLIGSDPPVVARHAATATGETAPADTPASNDLIDLVQAKHTSVLKTHDADAVQLDNFIYGARSFLNKEDLYYVDQEIQFAKREYFSALLWQSYSANLPLDPNTSSNVSLLRPSPETTLPTTTYTTGISFGIGGNTGYVAGEGLGANVAPGLSYESSTTTTVPPLVITYRPALHDAESHWIIDEASKNSGSNTILLRTSWIWAVPLEAYSSEQRPFVFDSLARMRAGAFYFGRIHIHADFTARVESFVDQPFPTKTILPPSIAEVEPKAVPVAGQATIAGEGFYPGLFANVLLGGNALPAANATNSSDRQIIVTVPNNSSSFPPGKPLAVQVNTSAGASNNNQTLTILRNTADQAANVLQ